MKKILIGVIIVIVIITAAFFFMRKNNPSEPAETESSVQISTSIESDEENASDADEKETINTEASESVSTGSKVEEIDETEIIIEEHEKSDGL